MYFTLFHIVAVLLKQLSAGGHVPYWKFTVIVLYRVSKAIGDHIFPLIDLDNLVIHILDRRGAFFSLCLELVWLWPSHFVRKAHLLDPDLYINPDFQAHVTVLGTALKNQSLAEP